MLNYLVWFSILEIVLVTNLLLYIGSFIFIWLGAGLVVSSVDRFSRKLGLSSFAVSFIILGILTSTPEFAVGLTAVAEHNPEIFIGNLLGGIPVIFLFIIPLLAIFGNGIRINHDFNLRNLLITLGVIIAPSVFMLDKTMNAIEGTILILLYIVLIFIIERKHGFFDRSNVQAMNIKAYSYKDLVKILLGIGIMFVASQIIVDKTIYFSEILNISTFYISLIALSLGTNLPELSLAARSVISGKKDIAFGDYMGSAAANTLLFGIFTLLSGGEVLSINNFFTTFFFVAGGLILFFIFSRSKNALSRGAGFILFSLYLIFAFFQLNG